MGKVAGMVASCCHLLKDFSSPPCTQGVGDGTFAKLRKESKDLKDPCFIYLAQCTSSPFAHREETPALSWRNKAKVFISLLHSISLAQSTCSLPCTEGRETHTVEWINGHEVTCFISPAQHTNSLLHIAFHLLNDPCSHLTSTT